MSSDPTQPPVIPGPRSGVSPTAGQAAAPAYEPTLQSAPPYSPPAFEPASSERSIVEQRPEILIGLATVGGFVVAQLLGRIRGR